MEEGVTTMEYSGVHLAGATELRKLSIFFRSRNIFELTSERIWNWVKYRFTSSKPGKLVHVFQVWEYLDVVVHRKIAHGFCIGITKLRIVWKCFACNKQGAIDYWSERCMHLIERWSLKDLLKSLSCFSRISSKIKQSSKPWKWQTQI